MLGLVGATAIETSVAEVTVRVAPGLTTPPSVAVITVVPAARVEATPAALIDATAGFDDAQMTWLVRLGWELSVYVPVAVNGCVSPLGRLGLVGVTAIETSAAGLTVSVSPGLTTPPSVAVIAVVPVARVDARPAELIDAAIG